MKKQYPKNRKGYKEQPLKQETETIQIKIEVELEEGMFQIIIKKHTPAENRDQNTMGKVEELYRYIFIYIRKRQKGGKGN